MQCGLPTTCEYCLVSFCVKICTRTFKSNFSPLTPKSSFSFSSQALRVFRVRLRCTPPSSKAQNLRRTAQDPFLNVGRWKCSGPPFLPCRRPFAPQDTSKDPTKTPPKTPPPLCAQITRPRSTPRSTPRPPKPTWCMHLGSTDAKTRRSEPLLDPTEPPPTPSRLANPPPTPPHQHQPARCLLPTEVPTKCPSTCRSAADLRRKNSPLGAPTGPH